MGDRKNLADPCIKGVCRTSNSTGQKTCHHNFPQSVDLLRLISSDITDPQQQAAWSSLLSLGSSMENNHPLISSLTKASGALLIISVFINLITLILAIVYGLKDNCLEGRCLSLCAVFDYVDALFSRYLSLCVVFDYVDALFILGPVVMLTYMFMNVTTGPGTSTNMGPGLILLWIAFVAKILADLRTVKAAMKRLNDGCGPRRRSNAEQRVGQCLEDCECCIVWETSLFMRDCLRW
jgi:hypothetical protein